MEKKKLSYDELIKVLREREAQDAIFGEAADKIEQLQRAYMRAFERARKNRMRWIEYPECLGWDGAYSEDHIVCSSCGAVFNIMDNEADRFNCCPVCGAVDSGDYIVSRCIGKRKYESFIEWGEDGKAVIGDCEYAMLFQFRTKAMEIAETLNKDYGENGEWKVYDVSHEACSKAKKLLDAIFAENEK